MGKLKLKKKYETYSTYKKLELDWVSRIPKEWEVFRLKNLGRFTSSGIDKKLVENEQSVRMVNYMDVYGNDSSQIDARTHFGVTTANKQKIKHHSIKKGDILFTPSSETIEDLGVSAVVCKDFPDVVYSYHLIRFRPKASIMNLEYSKFIAKNEFVLSQFSSLGTGTTRQVLGRMDFKNTIIFLPPLEIQSKTAEFLNKKTALIDKIIEKKKKQIELLTEKRTALIEQAVTKGLDKGVSLVESKIELVDRIPETWTINKLKHLGKAIIGLTYFPEDISDQGGTLVLRSSNVQNGKITKDNNVYVSKKIPNKLITRVGDILICSRNGSKSLIGKNALIDKNNEGLTFGAFMTVFRSPDYRFISYFLKSNLFQSQLNTTITSTINQLTTHYLNNISIVVPHPGEREKICDFLDSKLINYEKAVQSVAKSIIFLQEFKSSLVSNIVTGKVKV